MQGPALRTSALLLTLSGALLAQSNSAGTDTVRGRVANIQASGSRSTIEILPLDRQERRLVLQAANSRDGRGRGLTGSGIRVGDLITACGSIAQVPGGTVTMSVGQITLEDGRKITLGPPDSTACGQSSGQPTSQAAPGGMRGGIGPMPTSPVLPMTQSPIQPMTTAPVQGLGSVPVQPMTTSPVQPIGSLLLISPGTPTGASSKIVITPAEVQPRIALDPVESSYLELYDRKRPVKLAGEVTRVEWTSPNAYVFLNVGGTAWILESSFVRFRQIPVWPPIRLGDFITVSGYLPKEDPLDRLPAKQFLAAAPYLKAERLTRASEIILPSRQTLLFGLPPTDEEIKKRSWCLEGC